MNDTIVVMWQHLNETTETVCHESTTNRPEHQKVYRDEISCSTAHTIFV